MSNLSQQLADAQRRRQEAAVAERARLEAETTPQKRIAAADADIAALEKQVRAERFAEAVRENAALVAANTEARRALIAALDAHDIDAAIDAADTANLTFERQQQHAARALGIMAVDIDAATTAYREQSAWGGDQISILGAKQSQAAYWSQLPNAIAAPYVLLGYIAPLSGMERRIAQGLCFAVAGEVYNPGPDFDAQRAIDVDLAKRRSQF